ncbi:galactokinase [Anseongella ginsenosidimutans]|uniref:Galactokinase n=1 Tax=Anseongella ginsenosidimutans TaxID=496056 RepID=A0A4R3KVJ2_9SPHI|nr:galactokinase [Anseongella ginsenosidimutans]QEC51797.1 galactokinase [Anseongella ginsenosidimutans]TCS89168.1 galactokinase [Anseongella ginsenosidimutans]
MIESLKEEFKRIYKETPQYIFFAPGRVNLIGEHTDYNGGMALPAAISQGTWLLVSPNNKNKFVLRTLNLDDYAEVLVSPHYRPTNIAWVNYPLGLISRFTQEASGNISGLNMLFSGNIPQGAGLSSSASIEMATALALNRIFQGGLEKIELVKMALEAENNFVGVNCGILDQYAVTFGEKDTALALDCSTVTHRPVPCKLGEYTLLVINTNKSRSLTESKYNERFAQCREALSLLQQESSLQSLCELSPAQFENLQYLIPDPVIARRARHVVEENARVNLAANALNKGDIELLGQLMFDSHASLRELYEVTGRELDLIVELSQRKGVAGARMTGAGFGGSAIALVHQAELKNYCCHLIKAYEKVIGYEPQIFPVKIEGGVRQL